MTIKERFITSFWVVLVVALFCVNYITTKYVLNAENVYQVYLNGEVIGFILDDDELYNLINKRQKEIKEKYNVKRVYPPENFEIVKTNSYDVQISSAEQIYNRMAEMDTFTIEGYIVTISNEEDEDFEELKINILDKQVFDDAINNFVLAFVDNEDYINYMNDTQTPIETTGKLIELMYFDETITIKKGYISVKDKIYVDKTELSQYMLFGKDYKIESYKVKQGDTITTISEDNKLNPQEFLIANPQYTSKDSLLAIGDVVNITLIKPIMTFTYEVHEVSDSETPYEKKVVYDNTKSPDYSEITTPGVTGVTRITSSYIVKNGETQSGVIVTDRVVITEKVDQVTTKGHKYYVTGEYIDDGSVWAWPTNPNYVITSLMGWRWGAYHEGVDISGTGYGSPIFAIGDGEVIVAGNGGMMGWQAGYNVVIKHANGYYSVYAHMVPNSLTVKTNQTVTRGTVIGGMGASGLVTGTHLHFAIYNGVPYRGGVLIDPCGLWPGQGRCNVVV